MAGVRELPDQRVVLAHDPGRAGLDAVRAVDVVGTLHAAVGSLQRGEGAVTEEAPLRQVGVAFPLNACLGEKPSGVEVVSVEGELVCGCA